MRGKNTRRTWLGCTIADVKDALEPLRVTYDAEANAVALPAALHPRRHRRERSVEIAKGHVLHGRRWRIIGIGVPARDEVLLALADGEIASTHVTWKGAPEPPSWPVTTIVSSAGELRAKLADRGFGSTD